MSRLQVHNRKNSKEEIRKVKRGKTIKDTIRAVSVRCVSKPEQSRGSLRSSAKRVNLY